MIFDLSIIIPVYNEAGNIGPVLEDIGQALAGSNLAYEVILVDDGSRDGTWEEIKKHAQKVPHLRARKFLHNSGKSAVLASGVALAKGRLIGMMDGDGQDDPAEYPALVAKLDEGYDVVTGWKFPRRDPLSKRLPSKIYNHVTGFLTGLHLHDMNCGLKVFRREVLERKELYGELHRFILVLAHLDGYRVTEKPVNHRPRLHGKSKFGMYRYIAGFFDLMTVLFLTKFIVRPMHLFGSMGAASFLAGLGVNAYLATGWLFGRWIGNRPLLYFGGLLTILGVQLLSTGLIAELVLKFSKKTQLYQVVEEWESPPKA